MRKSKFSESRIVGILKDAEGGMPVADLRRKHGVSKPRSSSASDLKRLRELETENAKLKRMYGEAVAWQCLLDRDAYELALQNAPIR